MSDTSLTVRDYRIVLRSIWKDRTKWRNIGIELNFLDSDLDVIQGNCSDMDHCFTKLISKWLRQVNPKPTWEALVEALNSPLVDSKDTARTIVTKYIQKEFPLNSVENEPNLPEINRSHPLQEEMEKLDKRFADLIGETEKYLERNGRFSVPFFRKLFSQFPSTRRHQHKEFLDQCIFKADLNVESLDLWLSFCNYWHFINYELLQFIIEKCGASEDLIERMKKYDADMKVFCNKTSMHDFVKYCFPELYLTGLCAKCEHQHSVPLQVKVSNKLNRFSKLADLNYLGEDVAKTFSLPRICGLILKYVSPGCFLITWSVPSHYCKMLRWKLSICDKQFFKRHGIQSVHLNEVECYREGSERIPINPAEEIASNTDITGKVFDLQDMMEKVITAPLPITVTQLCTAYICKLLTQHLSTHPVYGGKGIQVCALSDLPPDVHTQFMYLSKLAHEQFLRVYKDLCTLESNLGQKVKTIMGSGQLHLLESTLVGKDLPMKIKSMSLESSVVEDTAGAVIPSIKYEVPENIDGLGLTEIEESSHVFIHRTVAEYLAALFFAKKVKVNEKELLQHINAFGGTSFLPYFVAGLKEWRQFKWYRFENINSNLFEFEASSFIDMYAHYDCYKLVKTVEAIVSHTTSSSESKWISPFKLSQPFSKGKCGIRDHIKVVNAFCSFVCGQLWYFSDDVFYHSWFECPFQYFTMGLISASESFYSSKRKKLSHSLGDLRIKVECTTPELDFLIKLPYSILKRISDLELFTDSGEADRVLSDVEDTDWLFTELLQKSTRLERLSLSVQDFNSTVLRKLQSNTSLKCLSLESPITAKQLTDLCNILKSSSLSELTLQHSGIGDSGVKELALVLQFNKLESLCLWNETIEVKGMTALADALLVNTTLKHLSLKHSKISCAVAKVIGEALKSNATLKRLRMDENCIEVDGAQALAEGLASNKFLFELSLGYNKILDDGAKALAKALTVNTTLSQLVISGNDIGDDGARAVADMLMVNTSLETLWIRSKAMTSKSAELFQNALLHNKVIRSILISKEIVQSEVEYDKRFITV